jgi:hypothetical protein
MGRNVPHESNDRQQPPSALSVSFLFTRIVRSVSFRRADLAEAIDALQDVLAHASMTDRMRSLLSANLSEALEIHGRIAAREADGAGPRSGPGAAASRVAPHGNHGDNLTMVLR